MNTKLTRLLSPAPRIARNPHFWIVLVMLAALAILYSRWPWSYSTYPEYSLFELRYLAIAEFKYKVIGSLFLIPLIYASIAFHWRGTVLTWLAYITVTLPIILPLNLGPQALLSNIIFLLSPLAIVAMIVFEAKWRSSVAQREKERHKYMLEIFRAQENERRRIAQELHDDIIQRLIGIANAQNLISRSYGNVMLEAHGSIESVKDMVMDVSEDLRKLSIGLRPSVLDSMGLVPSLSWLLDKLHKQYLINTDIQVTGVERRLAPEAEVIIFRIAQEALSNIARHSGATMVNVMLEFSPASIRLSVQDNGCGFSLPESLGALASENKLGIIGMREKATLINGKLDISSQLDQGTMIKLQAKC